MTDFLHRLKQRKLVQWAVAYAAAAFALLQGMDMVGQKFGWPDSIGRILIIASCVGFLITLVLAWYHGERGEQKVSGTELLLLSLLLVVGGGLLWKFAPGATDHAMAAATQPASAAEAKPAAAIPAKSIAVLPFENLSEDKGNAYFASGMQDLILTKLADIGELKVISRTSTMKYASRPDDLKVIARQLGVATILEGSVQKAGGQVLINVQLIDANTDSHLWAESYTRDLKNIFGVEGEVAGKIATALKAKLSPAEAEQLATSLSADPVANDLFLRAEYIANRGRQNLDATTYNQVVSLYRQAITKAPGFALARARLSRFEGFIVVNFLVEFLEGETTRHLVADARSQAEQALALAPGLIEAQLAIGYSDYYGRGDYAAALSTFEAVLKARPNDADVLAAMGYVLRRQGRFEEAIAALQRAFERNPRDSRLAGELGQTYMLANRYAEAMVASQRALALDPDNTSAQLDYSNAILFANGDIAAALNAAQGDAPSLKLRRVSLLTYQRKYHDALALLAEAPDAAGFLGGNVTSILQRADLYRLAGDAARAKPLFEQALRLARAQRKLQADGDIAELLALRSIADAGLGLGHTEAGLTALAQMQAPLSRTSDHLLRPEWMLLVAELYAQASRPDLAVPLLDKTLATPGIGASYSPVMLWIDPAWDPILHDPRFVALQKKYASAKPAAASSEATR